MNRFHVGRVDGQGPIWRHPTRADAQKALDGLKSLNPSVEFYLDGPEEVDPWNEQLVLLSKDILANLQLGKSPGKPNDSDSYRELDRLQRLPILARVTHANEFALLMGMAPEYVAACCIYLGFRLGKSEAEREQLEKLAK